MNFETLFGGQKPIIGMVHLRPLPGAPNYGGSMEEIWDAALADLEALTEGGITAAIVENFGDVPYTGAIEPITVNAMAIMLDRLMHEASIPLGVNVHYNCTDDEWNLAYLTGAAFLRVETFSENRMGPNGIFTASAPSLMRRRARYPGESMIFADIHVKHTFPMVDQPTAFTIDSAIESGADSLIVTGLQTGSAPTLDEVREMKSLAHGRPVLIGSGIKDSTIAGYLSVADGVIVGSSIKKDGNVWNAVDAQRVRRLVDSAQGK